MTSPPEDVEVQCPGCATVYTDWYRPSVNRSLGEDFDDEYLDAASSATCPACGLKVYFAVLEVTRLDDSGSRMRYGPRRDDR